METFDFDYHTPITRYPESGNRLQLGGSYMFSSEPTSPDQRVIVLHFAGMRNFCHPVTGVPDLTKMPAINFYRLEKFYQDHKLWRDFNYTHPQYGLLVVKFNKPLETPKAIPGLRGWVEAFSVELLEQP